MDLKKIGLGAALWAAGVAMVLWKQMLIVSLMKSNFNFSAANASMKPVDGFVGLFTLVMWVVGGILMVTGLRAKVAK
jgi:hypothetical protein